MKLREIIVENVNSMELAQDRIQWQAFLKTVMIKFHNNVFLE
jgi:hypothetical protein